MCHGTQTARYKRVTGLDVKTGKCDGGLSLTGRLRVSETAANSFSLDVTARHFRDDTIRYTINVRSKAGMRQLSLLHRTTNNKRD